MIDAISDTGDLMPEPHAHVGEEDHQDRRDDDDPDQRVLVAAAGLDGGGEVSGAELPCAGDERRADEAQLLPEGAALLACLDDALHRLSRDPAVASAGSGGRVRAVVRSLMVGLLRWRAAVPRSLLRLVVPPCGGSGERVATVIHGRHP